MLGEVPVEGEEVIKRRDSFVYFEKMASVLVSNCVIDALVVLAFPGNVGGALPFGRPKALMQNEWAGLIYFDFFVDFFQVVIGDFMRQESIDVRDIIGFHVKSLGCLMLLNQPLQCLLGALE